MKLAGTNQTNTNSIKHPKQGKHTKQATQSNTMHKPCEARESGASSLVAAQARRPMQTWTGGKLMNQVTSVFLRPSKCSLSRLHFFLIWIKLIICDHDSCAVFQFQHQDVLPHRAPAAVSGTAKMRCWYFHSFQNNSQGQYSTEADKCCWQYYQCRPATTPLMKGTLDSWPLI